MAEVGLDKVFGSFSLSSIQSGAMGIMEYVIWGIIILAVIFFAWKKWQDKKVFIYPTRIFRQRANGQVKELNVVGGYIKKNGITKYVIKMSSFKKKETDKLPLSELMDEDNRVYFWQVSPDAPLIQVERSFVISQILIPNENYINPTAERREEIIKKWTNDLLYDENFKEASEEKRMAEAIRRYEEQVDLEKNKLIDITRPTYSPVPTDLKQQAMAEIQNYRQTLGVDVNKQFAYFVAGVIALVIAGGVIFYIAVNKGDIPILTDFLPLLLLTKKINR